MFQLKLTAGILDSETLLNPSESRELMQDGNNNFERCKGNMKQDRKTPNFMGFI